MLRYQSLLYRNIFSFLLLLCCLNVNAQTAKEWRDSLSHLSAMIDKYPKDLELKMRKAEANIALEQWSYAMDEYSRILDLYPNHLGATYFRGYVNYKLRRYGFARVDYENVLKYEPRHIGALMGLVRTNFADGKKQKAIDLINFLVETYPDSANVYIFRAEIEDEMGMLDFAIDDLTHAIELQERHIGINQRLLGNEDYTQTVITRMELYRKKGNQASLYKMNADREMLIHKGIPSSRLSSYELKAKKKRIRG